MSILFNGKYLAAREIDNYSTNIFITLPQPLLPVFAYIHKQSSAITY